MSKLDDARALAVEKEKGFEAALAAKHPCMTRFTWFQQHPATVDKVSAAWDEYVEALHAFYEMRDGPSGFLGGRGL